MQQRMQTVLNQLVAKSREANLTFSPDKTVAMMFSPKKRKILTRLYIEGKKLNTVETTRYLGVIIDNKLSWTPHINIKNRPMQFTTENNNQKNKLILRSKIKTDEMGLHRNNKAQIHLRGTSVGSQHLPETTQKIEAT